MKLLSNLRKNLSEFKKTVCTASNGKWDAIKIAFDLMYCKMRFHVNNDEYLKYKFYNLKDRYRKNFLLVYHQKHSYVKISTRHFTRSKYILYRKIPDLFSREMILAPYCGEDTFVEFLKKHQKVIVKPDNGSLGRGIHLLHYTDEASARERFKQYSFENPVICEEYIRQHSILNAFNPFSVNTVRVVTILNGNDVEIIAAALKTGGAIGKFVDNMHSGGIGMQVDIETGITTTSGKDYHFNDYVYHPVTGVRFLGFQVPNWDKVLDLVKTAHLRLPQCLIFGWDVAITENGVDLIEANNAPGPLLMQTLDRIPKGEKVIKLIKTTKKIPQKYSKKDKYIPDYEGIFKSVQ